MRIETHAIPSLILSVILGVLFIMYCIFQARFFIMGPQLNIENPTSVTQHEQVLTVIGTAQNTVEVTVNGLPIDINRLGAFIYDVVLPQGYSILTITARDRFGRETRITRPIIYHE